MSRFTMSRAVQPSISNRIVSKYLRPPTTVVLAPNPPGPAALIAAIELKRICRRHEPLWPIPSWIQETPQSGVTRALTVKVERWRQSHGLILTVAGLSLIVRNADSSSSVRELHL